MSKKSIAIVGAGFAGLITAYQLVRLASFPIKIRLFDAAPESAVGLAYSTDCPNHLLNVPAGKMGAISGEPDHFYQWLCREPQKWRREHPSFEALEIDRDAYLPRMLYGLYLRAIKCELAHEGSRKSVLIERVGENVVDINKVDGRCELITASGAYYTADAVVLALSAPWTKEIPHDSCRGYLEAPWPQMTDMALAKDLLDGLNTRRSVCLIGSGLTMLDTLATLHYCGYEGSVSVISGRNLLPQKHGTAGANPSCPICAEELPVALLELFKDVRRRCKSGDWRSVMDSLRPLTKNLWQRMSLRDKKAFLRRLFPFWNTHRHRAPPAALAFVDLFAKDGRLEMIQAMVTESRQSNGGRIKVVAVEKNSGKEMSRDFDLVVNCSGPDYVIKNHLSPLVQNLLRKRYIDADELGLGIAGQKDCLYPVGALLFGECFETTAVSEIRDQCYAIAKEIL